MLRAERATTLVNFVLFQAGWFTCVLGAAAGHPLPAAAAGLVPVTLEAVDLRRDRGETIRGLLAVLAR